MERIDRQQRFSKKPIPAASEGHADHTCEADRGETASHWLSSAMAMWIQQGEAHARADQEPRHADTGKR
jgi:hypothetical protein